MEILTVLINIIMAVLAVFGISILALLILGFVALLQKQVEFW